LINEADLMIKRLYSFLGLLLLPLLVACSQMVDHDQPYFTVDSGAALTSGHAIGQTFVPHHGGLSGVEVWLLPGDPAEGEVRFYLRDDPQSTTDIRVATISIAEIREPGFIRFSFEPLPDSHGKYYYGYWEVQGSAGEIEMGAASGDAYLNGAAYEQHRPLDAQLAFRLVYAPLYAAVDFLLAIAQWGFWLLLTFLAFVLPGLVLLRYAIKGRSLSAGTWVGLSAGISLAVYPLVMLWTDWAGLHLGSLYAWLMIAVSLVGVAVARPWRNLRFAPAWKAWRTSDAILPDVAVLILVGMVFAVRLVVIRTLDAPLWGDSQQHATIVQLMLDNRGLFRSWLPYTPYETFTVHFGFHSVTAVFAWLTGMGAVQATLVMGQIVNALAILTLYPLAERLWNGNRWAGVGAVLVGGLLSPMPAFYVNWGRYPQLLGQAILPVAIWLVMEIVERRDRS
jgi:hypothetical protein